MLGFWRILLSTLLTLPLVAVMLVHACMVMHLGNVVKTGERSITLPLRVPAVVARGANVGESVRSLLSTPVDVED